MRQIFPVRNEFPRSIGFEKKTLMNFDLKKYCPLFFLLCGLIDSFESRELIDVRIVEKIGTYEELFSLIEQMLNSIFFQKP
jgi:hypothetical protein